MQVLRKTSFSERMIDMIYRLVSNNWYSILLNGQPKSFFNSCRGLKQGDPLSPTLFILAIELLSKALKALLRRKEFKKFGMPKGCPSINHLAFLDDMIILCKTEIRTIKLVEDTLKKYEATSDQKINKEKSAIYLHHSVPEGDVILAEVATEILRNNFSFTYLGCPIFYRKNFYN